jgi:hypothetical protein
MRDALICIARILLLIAVLTCAVVFLYLFFFGTQT